MKFIIFTFLIFSILLLIYIFPESPEFPKPPVGVVVSTQPADLETPFRRGYYTNLNRQQIIEHYEKEFNTGFIYTPRLNYPPEESQTIIRDQTKATYLEEIVHPLRESLYINGYEPNADQEILVADNKQWSQKYIIRYVPSTIWIRLFVVIATVASFYFLTREYAKNI